MKSLTYFFIYSSYFIEDTVKAKEYSSRVVNDETLSHINEKVASTFFSVVVQEEDTEKAVVLIHENLLQMYNECCPIKTKPISVKD